MKNIELLAPVGSYEALIASVQNGADAVYLAGSQFGARKFAKNFDDEEIVKAIQYAHIRGVAVYVTVNTLIKDEEWQAVTDYVDFLYVNDVDAVIVQDIGLASYLLTNYPDLPLHASTQMSAHSLSDVRYLYERGFSRVVVAREMPLEEIKNIQENVPVELEVFVHGALCISYSGQCLMSSYIGGRSGNRGSCAQPCRQLYHFDGETSYALSPKDLNAMDAVASLKDYGVASLKLEGRMKGPEYAATVVKAYRQKIDGVDEPNHLKQIFNRTYTRGFLMEDRQIIASDAPGNRGEYIGTVAYYDSENKRLGIKMQKMLHKGDEIQIRRATSNIGARTDVFYINQRRVNTFKLDDLIEVPFKHKADKGEKLFRTYDAEWMDRARHSYLKEERKIDVTAFISILEGQSIYMTLTDDKGNTVTALSEHLPEKAKNVALSADRVEKQLSKMGSTAYELSAVEIDLEEGLAVPTKAFNELRRQCTDQLDQVRQQRYDRVSKQQRVVLKDVKSDKTVLAVSLRTREQLDAVLDLDVIKYCYTPDKDVIRRLYRITTGERLIALKDEHVKSTPILVGNLGSLKHFDASDRILDYSLNLMNSYSIQAIQAKRATLSYEMDYQSINRLKSDKPLELIVYGHMPVMVMAYCPITKQNMHCSTCSQQCMNNQLLTDRFNEQFPMIRSDNRLEILSSKQIHLMPYLDKLKKKMDVLRLDFTIETPETVRRITKGYMEYMKTGKVMALENTDASHFLKGVE